MLHYEFTNVTGQGIVFPVFSTDYAWVSGSILKISMVDSVSVDLRFKMQALRKSVSNIQDAVLLTRELSDIISETFDEGSTAFSISFTEPAKQPEITLEIASNYMTVGDEMKFKVEVKNLPGEVKYLIREKDVAVLLPHGVIRAVGPGNAYLLVGTKDYHREFDITVRSKPEPEEEK